MKSEIGKRLRQIREHYHLSQTSFGKRLDIQYQHVSKYERGESVPTWENLIKLIRYFNVNVNWLLTGEGTIFQKPESDEPDQDNFSRSFGDEEFSLEDYLKTDQNLRRVLSDFVMKYKDAREAADRLVLKTEALKKLK